jgi:hypothetical protein
MHHKAKILPKHLQYVWRAQIILLYIYIYIYKKKTLGKKKKGIFKNTNYFFNNYTQPPTTGIHIY